MSVSRVKKTMFSKDMFKSNSHYGTESESHNKILLSTYKSGKNEKKCAITKFSSELRKADLCQKGLFNLRK